MKKYAIATAASPTPQSQSKKGALGEKLAVGGEWVGDEGRKRSEDLVGFPGGRLSSTDLCRPI